MELKKYAAWTSWKTDEYLNGYFSSLNDDELETLKFLVARLKLISQSINKKIPILEFGCGPVIDHAIAAAPYASEIYFADYLSANLDCIRLWYKKYEGMFDWSIFTKKILELESVLDIDIYSITEREDMLRGLKTHFINCDASITPAIQNAKRKFPLVMSIFCAESATSNKGTWRRYSNNIIDLVEEDGHILIAALKNSDYYVVGEDIFPCTPINEKDIMQLLIENRFLPVNIKMESVALPECSDLGYNEAMFIHAKRDSQSYEN